MTVEVIVLVCILALATETLGDRKKASRWLQTANHVLEGPDAF